MLTKRGVGWKAVQFDYDYLLAFATDKCMYCLSPVTVQLCVSMLETAGWRTRYFSPTDTPIDQDTIQGWAERAQSELMSDNCIDAGAINILVQTNIDATYNDWSTATTNTDINIFSPVTTFNTTTGETSQQDAQRAAALCYACQFYVDAACEAIKTALNEELTFFNIIGAALAVVAAIAAPFTAGASLAVAAAVGSAWIFLGSTVFSFINTLILNDLDARKEVACALLTQLTGIAPTAANFYEQAGGIATLGTNAGLISDAIALLIGETNTQQRQFNSFINILGEGYALAQGGFLPPCECCELDPHVWDWGSNNPDTHDGWELLTTDILPIIGADWITPPPDSNGFGYTNTFFSSGGVQYVRGGSYLYSAMVGAYYDLSAEEQACVLTEVELTVGIGAGLVQATIFADIGAGLVNMGAFVLQGYYPQVGSVAIGLSGVTRIAVDINSNFTDNPECYWGKVVLNFG